MNEIFHVDYCYRRRLLSIFSIMDGRIVYISLSDETVREEKAGEDFSIPSLYTLAGDSSFVLAFPCNDFNLCGMVAIYKNAKGKICRDYAQPVLSRHMKKAGVKAVVVSGVASKLSYLYMSDDNIGVYHCENIRFCSPYRFAEVLLSSPDDGFIAIGEAGEKLSPLSICCCDSGITTGRGGLASLMGKMNFKGIISHTVLEDDEKLQYAIRRKNRTALMSDMSLYGSAVLLDYGASYGWAPKNEFSPYYDPRLKALDGRSQSREYRVEKSGCPLCPVPCSLVDTATQMRLPSWMEAMCLGSNLGIFSTGKVTRLLHQCLSLGLDPCGAGEMLSYLNTLDNPDYTIASVKNTSLDEKCRILTLIASRKGAGEIVSGGFDALAGAPSIDGGACIYDLRGAHAQALFSVYGENTPCYVDLVRNLKGKLPAELTGRAAAYVRIYTHAMENMGIPAFFMLPLHFDAVPLVFAGNIFTVRLIMRSFSVGKIKNSELLESGLESVQLFDSLHGEAASLPSIFLIPGRCGYTDEVNMVKLMGGYLSEMEYIKRKAGK